MPPREAGARKRSHTKPLQQFFVTRSTRFLFPPLENNESVLRSAQKRVHMQLFSKSNWIKRSQITVQGLCSTLLWHRHEICLTYNEIGLCSPRFSLLSFAPSAPASLTERLTCTDVIGKRRFAKLSRISNSNGLQPNRWKVSKQEFLYACICLHMLATATPDNKARIHLATGCDAGFFYLQCFVQKNIFGGNRNRSRSKAGTHLFTDLHALSNGPNGFCGSPNPSELSTSV